MIDVALDDFKLYPQSHQCRIWNFFQTGFFLLEFLNAKYEKRFLLTSKAKGDLFENLIRN